MPELPEVQTIVDNLSRVLPGLIIRRLWTDTKKLIREPKTFSEFEKEIKNKKIISLERKGKNILINLTGEKTLLIHQKMTGHLLYGKWKRGGGDKWRSAIEGPLRDDPHNRFIRMIFYLSGGKELALCDMRKFAKVALIGGKNRLAAKDLSALGPDALDKSLTLAKFKKMLRNKNGKVKQILMDQSVIAGIGNIYADEILWQAGVHPLEKISNLADENFKAVYSAMRKILKAAIRAGGSSDVDFRNAFGGKGEYQNLHNAYKKHKTKCRRGDGGVIQKIRAAGRGTHFCPVHQRLL